MADILIIGSGLGGLAAATLLAHDGHQVTVLERDPASPPPVDEAWDGWSRRGVHQFRLPHYMLPRWWAEIRSSMPSAEPALDRAGALRFNSVAALPSSLAGPQRDDDTRFDTVTARRPV